MEAMWQGLALGLLGILMFLFLVVRGVPLRMGITRLRQRTFLIVDNDTHYTAPIVTKDSPEGIETKDLRIFGKTFRVKPLGGIKIGLAVPNEFVMVEAPIAAAIEEDNKNIDEPSKYVKMEKSTTKVKYNGTLVKLSELTKGIEEHRSPVLIKTAMSRAVQEDRMARERDPAKWGMFIIMVCIGLGFLAILIAKSGILG